MSTRNLKEALEEVANRLSEYDIMVESYKV
nr:MAG TPA: hypothetical protein [Caudoviricetes sp.]